VTAADKGTEVKFGHVCEKIQTRGGRRRERRRRGSGGSGGSGGKSGERGVCETRSNAGAEKTLFHEAIACVCDWRWVFGSREQVLELGAVRTVVVLVEVMTGRDTRVCRRRGGSSGCKGGAA
jgi:hypothetical protein